MSMVSPGYYIQEATKDKSYAELIEMRSEYIRVLLTVGFVRNQSEIFVR